VFYPKIQPRISRILFGTAGDLLSRLVVGVDEKLRRDIGTSTTATGSVLARRFGARKHRARFFYVTAMALCSCATSDNTEPTEGNTMGKSGIETQIFIPAPPEEVWAVLTDTESYPLWNPFIKEIKGALVEGASIQTTLQTPPGSRVQHFRPQILVFIANRELRWRGHVLIPNIVFTGEHYFVLTPEDGGTLFIHGEQFFGMLAGLIGIDKFVPSFEAMNTALRDEVMRR
jgi:hypothetical protein